jgi:hypothetical protein
MTFSYNANNLQMLVVNDLRIIFFLITFGMKNWPEKLHQCVKRIDEKVFRPMFHSKRE